MNATTNPPPNDDGMPAEIDFSGAARGKFYRPSLKLNLPVSDPENEMLKNEIAIIESVK